MNFTRLLRSTLPAITIAIASAALTPTPSHAQAWPNKGITLVVPFAAGGPTDVMARTLSVSLTKDPEVTRRFAELGVEIVPETKQTPEDLQNWLKSEINRLGPLIRAAGKFAD